MESWKRKYDKWVLEGQGGQVLMEIPDSGQKVAHFFNFVGSNAAVAAADVEVVTTGTITNATGLRPGDKVMGMPKVALATPVFLTGFRVPTNDTLNVDVGNLGTIAGSLAARGWDIFAVR